MSRAAIELMRPLFKTHGGKGRLHKWVISHFPEDYEKMIYVEPFGGGASVLLNKRPSVVEVLGDLNPLIYSIYFQIQNNVQALQRKLKNVPYCQESFEKALAGRYAYSINEIILRRMSRGGLKKDFSWSERLRGGQPGDKNGWETYVSGLSEMSVRLANVQLQNSKAKFLLWGYGPLENCLVYLDPPYDSSSRVTKDAYGEFEMTEKDHIELYSYLSACDCKILLSGYHSALYDRLYSGWNCVEKVVANNSGQTKVKNKRTEVLWKNY